MRQTIYWAFLLALGIVLGGRILNWFIEFPAEAERLLDISMFSLLGILWLNFAWTFNHKYIKALFILGGGFLLLHPWISLPDFLSGFLVVLAFLPWVMVKIRPGRFA